MNNGDFKPKTAMGSAINGMASDIHLNAVKHGFYEEADDMIAYLAVNDLPGLVKVAKTNFVLAQIAKIASEAGEAVSAIQHGNWNELPEELAAMNSKYSVRRDIYIHRQCCLKNSIQPISTHLRQ